MTLPYLTSPMLSAIPGIAHGFFTRKGGISSGLYADLNVGYGSADKAEAVTQNRALIKQAINAQHLATLHQIHSAHVVCAQPGQGPKADGHYCDEANIALGILTADCVPVLLAATDGSRIAAVHAGWRGAVSGIIGNAAALFGGKEIAAAIGPAISQASYEVGQDVYDAAGAPQAFTPGEARGKYQFDLKGLVAAKLAEANVAHIDDVGCDTYADADRFFSFRRATHRNEPDYGRQMSVIMKTP